MRPAEAVLVGREDGGEIFVRMELTASTLGRLMATGGAQSVGAAPATLDDWFVVEAAARYRAGKGVDLFVRGSNLFDELRNLRRPAHVRPGRVRGCQCQMVTLEPDGRTGL